MSCTCGLPTCSLCGTGGSCGPGIVNTFGNPNLAGCVPCCQNAVPATPTPYYAGCSACPEDHNRNVIIQNYAAALKVQTAWNVPDCDQFATVSIPGLSSITIGSYLWNPTYGFFQVTGFNSATQQVVILNTCVEGNATAGTQVPACTDFNLSSPPCNCSNQNPSLFPYLAVDFTAPSVDDCTNITVTNVNGLQIGKQVAISTGTYTLDDIINPTTITICNNGDGDTPGTIVVAKDAAGNYQYPLVVVDSNPCSTTAVNTGSVTVCNTSNIITLASLIPGTVDISDAVGPANIVVPALTGTNLVEAKYISVDAKERLCSTTTGAVVITSGDPTYTLPLASVTGFQVHDVLEIAGRDERFTITAVGGSSVDVTAVPTPGSNGNIPSGSWVCHITCCESLTTAIETPFVDDQTVVETPVTYTSASPTTPGNVLTFTIPAWPRPLIMMFFTQLNAAMSVTGGNTDDAVLTIALEASVDGGAYGSFGGVYLSNFTRTDSATLVATAVTAAYTNVPSINTAHSIRIRANYFPSITGSAQVFFTGDLTVAAYGFKV